MNTKFRRTKKYSSKKCENINLSYHGMLLFMLSVLNFSVEASTVSVGLISDSDCDYNSIQNAIDNVADFSTINVVSNSDLTVFNENLNITKKLTISGGYTDCAAANIGLTVLVSAPLTLINGDGTDSVIKISNNARLYLRQVHVRGGNGFNGGGIYIDGGSLYLNTCTISNNSANYGGGIYAINSALLEFDNSKIISNSSSVGGGGVYASQATLLIYEDSGISENSSFGTNANGGGLYLIDSTLELFAGSDNNPQNKFLGINNNKTFGHGGGIYAEGSSMKLYGGYNYSDIIPNQYHGDVNSPVSLIGNQADFDNDATGYGGAVYMVSSNNSVSTIEVHKGKISNNSAYNGGAFYLGDGSQFTMHRDTQNINGIDIVCWSSECSELSNNHSLNKGGAIYALSAVNTTITQTVIFGNRANSGTVLSSQTNAKSQNIKLHQNLIYHNGYNGSGDFSDNNVFELLNNSSQVSGNALNTEIMFNTITDNYVTDSVFNFLGVNIVMDVFSSIVYDSTSPKVANFQNDSYIVNFDCVDLLEPLSSLSEIFVNKTRNISITPNFIFRHYDYHLKSNSLVIDYCDNSKTQNVIVDKDINDEARAYDYLLLPSEYGNWDLGSDEYSDQTNETDLIFANGFDWN